MIPDARQDADAGALPRFSVVIPVFEDAERLDLCLAALAGQTIPSDTFEVLVVDNGSKVAPEVVVSKYSFARLLQETRVGSYAARNAAIGVARGQWLAFTDADCRPCPDWLANAVRYFEAHPEVDAIGGRIQLDQCERPTAAELYERLYAFPQEIYVKRDGFAATANMIVRRDTFMAVGPFNDRMRSGGDREWGQRATLAGYAIRYSADVAVMHPPRASLCDLTRKARRVTASRHVRLSPEGVVLGLPAGYRHPGLLGALQTWRMLLLHPQYIGYTRTDGLRVLMVRSVLAMARFIERWRLRLGGAPLR